MTDQTERRRSLIRVLATTVRELAKMEVMGEEPAPPPVPATGPLLLGVSKAAQFLGVSRATLWRMANRGVVKRIDIGIGSYRVSVANLIAIAAWKPSSGRPEGSRPEPGS